MPDIEFEAVPTPPEDIEIVELGQEDDTNPSEDERVEAWPEPVPDVATDAVPENPDSDDGSVVIE